MSGGHAHALYVKGDTPIHRLAPQCKIAAQVLFVFVVVLTPREAFWAFAAYALMLGVIAHVADLPPRFMLKRLLIEIPFVLFAVMMPFFGSGERVQVLGLSLTVSGLWAAWNILIKGTLGVAASVIVAATTPMAELLRGLDRLRLPREFTAIAGFMIRYLDVISGEAQRMKVARLSRGDDPRWLWQVKGFAASAGALFIRSYERGERVHLAMLSRGYGGSLPETRGTVDAGHGWAAAMTVPGIAALIAAVAWAVQP